MFKKWILLASLCTCGGAIMGGSVPISLGQWLTHFSAQTQFRAVPFARSSVTENALKTPERLDGANVWVDGQKYLPAQVLK